VNRARFDDLATASGFTVNGWRFADFGVFLFPGVLFFAENFLRF
jgi:hypothetical protein